MTSKELQKMAPELLAALESLYEKYAGFMESEYSFPDDPWTPERDNDTPALEAKRLIDLARQ
ncbi:hypothetical protein EGM97_09320 [Pseudomonas sp. AF32]|uniref:hypothetical protein n=1 Tax=Pseudomonas sp. AF32 TaxID=554390 RepID=UPI001EEEEB93|nr:hypothetical protein [Pseudomonas sp. AF32]MCG6574905.1 hypothetical protein [Pseudomonas sp. AF32]